MSQRGATLVTAIRFFFSRARHLTRFSSNELLPHRSNERAEFCSDHCDAFSVATKNASAPRSALAIITR
jgi:hypothetical protein